MTVPGARCSARARPVAAYLDVADGHGVQFLRIGDEVELDDAALGDGEADDGDRAVSGDDDQPCGAVDDRTSREAGEAWGACEQLLRHLGRAADETR